MHLLSLHVQTGVEAYLIQKVGLVKGILSIPYGVLAVNQARLLSFGFFNLIGTRILMLSNLSNF